MVKERVRTMSAASPAAAVVGCYRPTEADAEGTLAAPTHHRTERIGPGIVAQRGPAPATFATGAVAILIAMLVVFPAPPAAAQGARPWDLSLRAFVEYDDNVALNPEDKTGGSAKGSFVPGTVIAGTYRLYEDINWTVGVGGTSFLKQPLNGAVDDFSVIALAPGVFADYRIWPRAVPTTIRTRYDFRRDWVGGAGFESQHTLSWAMRVRPRRNLTVGPRYGFAVKEFDDDGGDPKTTSRDSLQQSIGFDGTYMISPGRRSVDLGYGFTRNDADGANFTSNAHQVSIGFTTVVVAPVFLILRSSYARVTYADFATRPKREQNNLSLQGVLYAALGRHLSVDLAVSHAPNESNLASFESRRTTVVFGATYKF